MLVKVKIEDAVKATVDDPNIANGLTKPDNEKTPEERQAAEDFKNNMENDVLHLYKYNSFLK